MSRALYVVYDGFVSKEQRVTLPPKIARLTCHKYANGKKLELNMLSGVDEANSFLKTSVSKLSLLMTVI